MKVIDWTHDELREIRASWPAGTYTHNAPFSDAGPVQKSYEALYWRYVKALIWRTRYKRKWVWIAARLGVSNNCAKESCARMQLYVWRLRQNKKEKEIERTGKNNLTL